MIWAAFLLIAGGAACIAYVAYSVLAPALAVRSRNSAPGAAHPPAAAPLASADDDHRAGHLSAETAQIPPPPDAFRRVELESLAEGLRLLSQARSHPPAAEPGLTIQGSLYLDYGRRIFRMQPGAAEQLLKIFPELKRIGPATLSVEPGAFRILCGHAIYSYTASELEQILFQPGGLALLPASAATPAPLFLSERAAEVRLYLKKRARTAIA